MKIKSVEISAFRIYDDPKQATFNFTCKDGTIANFVSLYAPNGFGKTSLYDAIEWGITKSINRFYIRNQELEKLANFQAAQNDLPLIRNSKSIRDTYVKIDTDSKKYEQKFKKAGRQVHDLNFKKHVVDDFQQVILSQEWISAFLTESDGETRYKKFMEKPDLVSLNNYYNNLKLQLGVLEDEKTSLNDAITRHKKDILSSTQEGLLNTINSQIEKLNSKHKQSNLFKITLATTREEVKKLKDIIATNQISINREDKLSNLLEDISIAKTGNNSILGIKLFFEQKTKIDGALNDLFQITKLIGDFDEIESKKNELLTIIHLITNLSDSIIKCDETINSFEEYEKHSNDIISKSKEIEELKLKIASISKRLENGIRQEGINQNKLDSTIQQIDLATNRLKQLPKTKEAINKLTLEISSIESFISAGLLKIQEYEKRLLNQNGLIESLNVNVTNLKDFKYSETSVSENEKFVSLIRLNEKNYELLLNEKIKLKELNKQIESQNELDITIRQFIETGLSIVNERQSSNCPLCEHEYNSYSELAEKIGKNTALSKILQQLFLDQTALVNNITLLESKLNQENESLRLYYISKVNSESIKAKEIEELIYKQRVLNTNNTSELELKKTELTEHNVFLEGNKSEVYEKNLKKTIAEYEVIKNVTTAKLNDIKSQNIKDRDQVKVYMEQVAMAEGEIENIGKNEVLLKTTAWFTENLPEQPIELDKVIDKKYEQQKHIDSSREKQKQINQIIEVKNKKLTSYTKETLIFQQQDLQNKNNDYLQQQERYKDFLKQRFHLEESTLSEKQLSAELNKLEKNYRSDLEKNAEIKKEYEKLERYAENISSFLQSENAKNEIIKLTEQIKFLELTVSTALNDEKENSKKYLQERIQTFFYEKLINELYKKIDPHPDFKEVVFKADFESDSPRLDVFVKNTSDESMLIPNLYFSTAQINILSLSIFLATALNSEKYDCIFIDDPIQSMDSINILSTIDLLRSIVVNHDKQIILSTHDENFHNLLQKKIPADIFNSKYLELESFGKIKATVFN